MTYIPKIPLEGFFAPEFRTELWSFSLMRVRFHLVEVNHAVKYKLMRLCINSRLINNAEVLNAV